MSVVRSVRSTLARPAIRRPDRPRRLVRTEETKWLATHVALLAGLSATALAAVAKIGDAVLDGDSGPFDHAVRARAIADQSPALRAFFEVASKVGAPSALIPTALVMAAWLWRGERMPHAAAMVTAPALAAGAWIPAKQHFGRARPPGGAPGGEHTASFPSGHATTSAAIFGALAYVLWRERLLPAAPAVALATLPPAAIGASRVYLDVHWATDVLGGWCVGAIVAMLSGTAYERARIHARRRD